MWGRRRPHTLARAQGALPRARPADSPLQRLRRKESRRSYPLRSSSLIVASAHRGRGESCTLRILTDAFTGAHEDEKKDVRGRGRTEAG